MCTHLSCPSWPIGEWSGLSPMQSGFSTVDKQADFQSLRQTDEFAPDSLVSVPRIGPQKRFHLCKGGRPLLSYNCFPQKGYF